MFFQNTVILRRSEVANFADIKTAVTVIKTIFQIFIKVERITNYI